MVIDDMDQPFARSAALDLARSWGTLMAMGAITIVVGVLVMAWPGETLVVLSVLFGLQLLVLGLFRLVSAFSEAVVYHTLAALTGIVLMVTGIVVVRNPFGTVEVLATLLGVAWIVGGALDIVAAVGNPERPHRLLHGLSGLLSFVAGIAVVAWPAPTIAVVAWIGGLQVVVVGAVMVAIAFAGRRAAVV